MINLLLAKDEAMDTRDAAAMSATRSGAICVRRGGGEWEDSLDICQPPHKAQPTSVLWLRVRGEGVVAAVEGAWT